MVCLGLIFGILGGLYFEKSRSPLFFVYGVMVFSAVILTSYKKERKICQRVCISKGAIIVLIFSILVGFLYLQWMDKKKYMWNLDTKEVSFIGEVQKREISNGMERYIVKVYNINGKKIVPKVQVRMQCKETGKELLEYGSKIAGKGIWQEFSRSRNEGTFDEKQYRKSQGITAKISMERSSIQEKKVQKNWVNAIKEEREKFATFLEKGLGEKESAFASAIFIRRKE